MRAPTISWQRLIASGALGLPLAFAALPIYVHLPRYYAETTGLTLAWLGIVLLAARLFDALIDPLLGWLADRVARPRLLAWALPLLAFGFFALLNPPRDTPELAGAWLLASLTLTYIAFSAASVAYPAWTAEVGGNSAQRTRLTAAREGCGLLGVVLAAALPGVLAADLNDGVARLGWLLPPLLRLAARYGRVRAWQLAMLLAIVSFVGAGRLDEGAFWPFAAICVASGLALGADLALPSAMLADIGERLGQSGACFGVWNLVAKLNLALAAGLALPLVAALGYLPGSGAGLSALTFAYALLPLAFKALAAWLLWRWRDYLEPRP